MKKIPIAKSDAEQPALEAGPVPVASNLATPPKLPLPFWVEDVLLVVLWAVLGLLGWGWKRILLAAVIWAFLMMTAQRFGVIAKRKKGEAYPPFLRNRVWPICSTIGLGLLVLLPAGLASDWVSKRMGVTRSAAMPWLAYCVASVVMLVIALGLMGWLTKGHLSEYGLRWPKRKSYVLPAIAWAAFFGVLMTLLDYLPQILSHTPPPEHLSLTTASITGWLGFEAIVGGFGMEIFFCGLLQSFLMQRTSGRVRFLKFDMHIAGVILAILFALFYIDGFWYRPFWFALVQPVCAFAVGILYAYWREKSGSVLAPILGNNVSHGVKYALLFLLAWLWH
jgi:hypothetical protein